MTYTILTYNGIEKSLAAMLAALCLSVSAAEVTMAWDPMPCDYFVLSIGTQSGVYSTNYETTNTMLTVSNLDMAKTYYFSVRAESNGVYSPFSSEVQYFIPPPLVGLHVISPKP